MNGYLIAALAITWVALIALALGVGRKLRRLRRMLRQGERHVWESHNVFQVLGGGKPLPPAGGWAASSDLLGELLRVIALRRPHQVVELGSGLSTLVIAAALRSNGSGHLISIDAEDDYAQGTRAQLQAHGLGDWAEVRVAPLRECEFEGERRPWYELTALSGLQDIDLLFIDGPPTALKTDIRYPSLPFFWSRLNPGATVLMDDAGRKAERHIARRWRQRLPQARYRYLRLEKGALRVDKD